MYAYARHGGLRPKRGLTVQFHPKTAHYPTKLKDADPTSGTDSSFKHPLVAVNSSCRPKARQLTLFYGLLPHLCRIRAKA